jgi:hypothetical protein
MDHDILEKVKIAGFKSTNEFVKANLHYLPDDKKSLFYKLERFNASGFQDRYTTKTNSYMQKS